MARSAFSSRTIQSYGIVSVFKSVANSNESGLVRFDLGPVWREFCKKLTNKGENPLSELSASMVWVLGLDNPLLRHRVQRIPRLIADCDAQIIEVKGKPNPVIEFNLAKLLGLPMENPKEELTHISNILSWMKDQMSKMPLRQIVFSIHNEPIERQERHGYMTISVTRLTSDEASPSDAEVTKKMGDRLNMMINRNPTWLALMDQVSSSLDLDGREGFISITERTLFGENLKAATSRMPTFPGAAMLLK